MPRVNTLISIRPNFGATGNGEFYSFSANTTSVNEGNTVLFTVSTRNVSETTLYWTIVAVSGTFNSLDTNSLSGSFNLTSNVGTFPITLLADSSTEGTEIFQLQLRKNSTSGTIVANSSFIIANDTSLTPSYTLTANTTSVNEGSTVSFTVDTQNVANGTVLYWTTLGVSGTINASDFLGSQTEGTVTINSNAASFIRTLSNDLSTEGTESFRIQLRRTSNTGTIVANSQIVTISDTSITPPVTGQVLFYATNVFARENDSSNPFYNRSTTLSWVVPAGVTSISVVTIGSGGGGRSSGTFTAPSGGGGGGLSYRNNISVTPGETLWYTIGHGSAGGRDARGDCSTLWRGSPFASGSTLLCGATGGDGCTESADSVPNAPGGDRGRRLVHNSSLNDQPTVFSGTGSTTGSDGGGNGGQGGTATGNTRAAGGGGAAGYSGNGGNGGSSGNGFSGSGGGGGGGGSGTVDGGAGGGTLPYGESSNGDGGIGGTEGTAGGGGTVLNDYDQRGIAFGGGGAGKIGAYANSFQNGAGEVGCVRIIWPGDARQFPSTRTADE